MGAENLYVEFSIYNFLYMGKFWKFRVGNSEISNNKKSIQIKISPVVLIFLKRICDVKGLFGKIILEKISPPRSQGQTLNVSLFF